MACADESVEVTIGQGCAECESKCLFNTADNIFVIF